jgi:hypothetical protein
VLPPVILSILKWADSQDYPATIVGAVAVCLHGIVRTTDDVDLLVMTTDSPSQVLESLEAAGYEPRFADPVVFAEASRVLLVRHSESGVDVDVMLGMLPFEQDCVDGSVVKRALAKRPRADQVGRGQADADAVEVERLALLVEEIE